MSRKICVVTGGRAEYGLLRWVMEEIRKTPGLELQVVATGMHLSPQFGLTYKEIEADGFVIDRKVESLLASDSSAKTSTRLLSSFGRPFTASCPLLARSINASVLACSSTPFAAVGCNTSSSVSGVK